jgi:NDP-sugar pyrophosphorylase family protein
MKAMILAAGVGARLKPLTDSIPKALVEVGGMAMIERVARRLIASGVDGIIANTHHLAEAVESFVRERRGFGVPFEFSREEDLLLTGGGLKKAAWFLDGDEPFFLHNADVLGGADPAEMFDDHLRSGALATLSVRTRPSSRYFLFDSSLNLRGWQAAGPRAPEGLEPLAFDGIHVLSPRIFRAMTETGAFDIRDAYLRLSGLGEEIRAFRADERPWADIGGAARLEAARAQAWP